MDNGPETELKKTKQKTPQSAVSMKQLPVLTVASVKQDCQIRACIMFDAFGQFIKMYPKEGKYANLPLRDSLFSYRDRNC